MTMQESVVKLIQDCNEILRKDEIEKQFFLQIVMEDRKIYIAATKSCYAKINVNIMFF